MSKTDERKPGYERTLREVAQALGMSTAGVQKLRQSGMPGDPGAWPLVEIVRWKMRRDFDLEALGEGGKPAASTSGSGESPGLEEYRRWRAREQKVKTLQLEGSVVSRDDVQRQWAVRTIAMTQAVKACGKKIAPEDPALRAEIDEYLVAQLRNWAREMPAVDESMVRDLFEHLGIAEEVDSGEG